MFKDSMYYVSHVRLHDIINQCTHIFKLPICFFFCSTGSGEVYFILRSIALIFSHTENDHVYVMLIVLRMTLQDLLLCRSET